MSEARTLLDAGSRGRPDGPEGPGRRAVHRVGRSPCRDRRSWSSPRDPGRRDRHRDRRRPVPPPRRGMAWACRCASSSTTCGASATGSIVSSPSSGTLLDVLVLNETGGRLALRRVREGARDAGRAGSVVAVPATGEERRPRAPAVADRRAPAPPVRRRPQGPVSARCARGERRPGRRRPASTRSTSACTRSNASIAEELADLTRGRDGPVLIGGDRNETPDGRAMTFLGERFWDAAARWRRRRRDVPGDRAHRPHRLPVRVRGGERRARSRAFGHARGHCERPSPAVPSSASPTRPICPPARLSPTATERGERC